MTWRLAHAVKPYISRRGPTNEVAMLLTPQIAHSEQAWLFLQSTVCAFLRRAGPTMQEASYVVTNWNLESFVG